MPFEIGHAPKGSLMVSPLVLPTAQAALETVEAFQASDVEVRYIKNLAGCEIGIGELRLLAEREGDTNA
jgi:hypothetical protein